MDLGNASIYCTIYTVINISLFQATLNRVKTDPLLKALKDLGGWPMLNPTWDPNSVNLTDLIGKINKDYGLSLLVSFKVVGDFRNTSKSMLMVRNFLLLCFPVYSYHPVISDRSRNFGSRP